MISINIGFLLHLLIYFKFCNGIFDGWYAEPSEYPFAVCLVNIPTNVPLCAGMIVNNEKILTAGHCLEKDLPNTKVVAGVLDITNKNSDHFQESNISGKKIHPKYEKRKGYITLYNIGVAILENPFMFTDTVKPLAITTSNKYKFQEIFYTFNGNKEDCVTFGWGSTAYNVTDSSNPIPTNYSMKLKVVGMMPEEYKKCSNFTVDKYDLQSIGIVCATPTVSKSGPCRGDGGAGLVCGSRKYAFALLTESKDQCAQDKFVVYLLFSDYIEEFGLEHNADFAMRNMHVGNHILLIPLSTCLFSWYFQQPYP